MCRLLASASVLLLLLWSHPVMAFERLRKPNVGAALVLPAADLERSYDYHRQYRSDMRLHWRQRAAYARWLHNEYVRAGYPVEHRQYRTYARAVGCCCCRRDWRW